MFRVAACALALCLLCARKLGNQAQDFERGNESSTSTNDSYHSDTATKPLAHSLPENPSASCLHSWSGATVPPIWENDLRMNSQE